MSAYVGSSKNTKDLKVPLQMVSAPPSARERESEPERDCARECLGPTDPGLRGGRSRRGATRCARAAVEGVWKGRIYTATCASALARRAPLALGTQPRAKSLRSSYTGLHPQTRLHQVMDLRRAAGRAPLQGYLAPKKQPPPLGPPYDPRYVLL